MAERLFGWPRDEILGLKLSETIIPERLRNNHMAGMKHLLKTGESPVLDQRIELPAMRKSGREIPVEISISAARTNTGYIFVSYIRDISQQKKREEERRQALHAFELALPMLIADSKGHIIRINHAFLDMLGYKTEDVIGEKPRSLSENPNDKSFHTQIWLALLGRGHWNGQLALRHKAGYTVQVKAQMKAHRNGGDEMHFYVAKFEALTNKYGTIKREAYLEGNKQSPL